MTIEVRETKNPNAFPNDEILIISEGSTIKCSPEEAWELASRLEQSARKLRPDLFQEPALN